tara:strand:- start:604 stop:2361 length:1758 start_codon:yes stop_codon:yes gene_type:complete
VNYFKFFEKFILKAIERLAQDSEVFIDLAMHSFSVERPKDPKHGDISTNVAMILAKQFKMKPIDLAELIVPELVSSKYIVEANLAGPGFINIQISTKFWKERLRDILLINTKFGNSNIGSGRKINVEYVSANPTGPMHVGHGRGAVVGDVLSKVLEKSGFEVTKEYYINDAGNQVNILAHSVYFRYCELNGKSMGVIPEEYYQGSYLIDLAEELQKRDGNRWLDLTQEEWLPPIQGFAIKSMMQLISKDLNSLGVFPDVFRSEKEIIQTGMVDAVMSTLADQNLIYEGTLDPPKGRENQDWESNPQTLFLSTKYGDDIDRAIKKTDGSWTYFASDMAYHLDKYQRGFNRMINIWGFDHGGYVKRMTAAVSALTRGDAMLDVKLCQLVNLIRDGQQIKMSKRSGTFLTLGEVIREVGRDAFRFFMLTRKNDAPLDFDLTKVLEESKDNPVYYIQYSHARGKSVLRRASEIFDDSKLVPEMLAEVELDLLDDPLEINLIKIMASWPRVLEDTANSHEPHRIAYFLIDMASAFHNLWTKGARQAAQLRFISIENEELTMARLAMVQSYLIVVASALEVMGITPLNEMR